MGQACRFPLPEPDKQKDSLYDRISELIERIENDSLKDFNNYRYHWVGDCYKKLGNEEKAFEYYRLSLVTGEFDYMMAKRRNFGTMASYFLQQQQYDSILYYYSIVEKAKPRRAGCGTGKLNLFTNYKYWLMAALDGKGMTDSAIKVFIPFAFQEWTNNEGTEFSTEHLFENDYHCQMVHFLNILEKKYCFDDLARDISAFTDPGNFSPQKELSETYCMYRLNFKLRIQDLSYDLYGWNEYCSAFETNKKEILEHFIDYAISDIQNSFIYRYTIERKKAGYSPTQQSISPVNNL